MSEEIKHCNVEQRYRIVIERAASTKGTLGYKIEANGDDLRQVGGDAEALKSRAESIAGLPVIQ